MLADLLIEHRADVLESCLARIRAVPSSNGRSSEDLIDDLMHFVDEVIGALRKIGGNRPACGLKATGDVAPQHAKQRWRLGFELDQLIHDYGFVCDAITDIAEKTHTPIQVAEYRVLNQSIDTAIGEAVNEYLKHRDASEERQQGERMGYIAHELRNSLSTSIMALQAIRRGQLSVTGRTADALERGLRRLKELVDYLLSDIRLRIGDLKKTVIRLAQLFDDVEAAAALHASLKGLRLSVHADPTLALEADHLLIMSAVMNLTLNAIKYTPDGGLIQVRGWRHDGEAYIEVEDECGGLPDGSSERFFEPFEQGDGDQSGLGLGLSIARQAVNAHGGTISIRNLAGKGCVFTVRIRAMPAE